MEIRQALTHWRPACTDPRYPDLTYKQYRVLRFMQAHVGATGLYPTYSQVLAEFDFRSPNSVTQNYEALERKGYLDRTPEGWRLPPALLDAPGPLVPRRQASPA